MVPLASNGEHFAGKWQTNFELLGTFRAEPRYFDIRIQYGHCHVATCTLIIGEFSRWQQSLVIQVGLWQ